MSLEEFNNRFGNRFSQEEAENRFRSQVINAGLAHISGYWTEDVHRQFSLLSYDTREPVYILEDEENFPHVLFCIENMNETLIQLANSYTSQLKKGFRKRKEIEDARKRFLHVVKKAVDALPIGISYEQSKRKIKFYPGGADELDEALIDDTLEWLDDHPKPKDPFSKALDGRLKGDDPRTILDNLRLSLELLLKEVLDNSKSLENQESSLGKFLKDTGANTEIRNLFWTLLDKYSKYQNEHVKHDNTYDEEDVEFLFYFTGTMMRYLISRSQQ